MSINLFCEKSKENLTKSIPFIKLVLNSILFVHGCHFGWRPLDIISKFFLHKHRNQNPFRNISMERHKQRNSKKGNHHDEHHSHNLTTSTSLHHKNCDKAHNSHQSCMCTQSNNLIIRKKLPC